MPLTALQADITKVRVDAIVNAANTSLLGGSGVDGAIHKAAGPALLDECRAIRARQGGCKVGEAVITGAGRLPSKYVIHTVGPVWGNNPYDAKQLLARAYRSCLELAASLNLASIAFPNISTGIYRFPKDLAAEIAIATCTDWLATRPSPTDIRFVCFDAENLAIYQRMLSGDSA